MEAKFLEAVRIFCLAFGWRTFRFHLLLRIISLLFEQASQPNASRAGLVRDQVEADLRAKLTEHGIDPDAGSGFSYKLGDSNST